MNMCISIPSRPYIKKELSAYKGPRQMTKYKRGYVFYINKALNLACDKLLQHST
jgi:hypothetical protein